MSRHWSILGLSLVLCFLGCRQLPSSHSPTQPAGLQIASSTPTAPELVALLNDNAQRVRSLECHDLDMDCSQGRQSVGLRADMVCQKPRNFRLSARVVGKTAVDLGSNDREFWFWISQADPAYLFHCGYEDLEHVSPQAIPFQPDWIMDAMGLAEFDPARPYQVIPHGNMVDLVESTVTPQKRPVLKVTRLTRTNGRWQVTAHLLEDISGKQVICSAAVLESQQDPTTQAVFPRKVQLDWPEQNMRLKIRLSRVDVNPPSVTQRAALLFTRPNLQDVPSYDLAHGLDRAANPLRAAGGFTR